MNRRILIAALAAWIGTDAAAVAADGARVKAWIGARIIDGTGKPAIERGTIIIQDGRIQQVGAADRISIPVGSERINATGKTIIPGLINTHGHVGDPRGLKSGPEFYTQRELLAPARAVRALRRDDGVQPGRRSGAGFKLRDEQDAPAARSRAHRSSPGRSVTGDTPEEARSRSGRVAAMKADFIKIRVDDNLGTTPKMPPEVYRAVIERGARAQACASPSQCFTWTMPRAAGRRAPTSSRTACAIASRRRGDALLKQRDVCLCPTLTREVSTFVYETTPAFFKDPFFLREADTPTGGLSCRTRSARQAMREERERAAVQAGARGGEPESEDSCRTPASTIAFGTDTGPPARFQGYFEHLELEMMVKAGLTPAQVLTSATSATRRDCMKVAGRLGTLEPGAWADFVVLDKNPLEDIRNTRTIESVWIAGNRLPGR